jgi:hypothetical protein
MAQKGGTEMLSDKIGNVIKEGDLLAFRLPEVYHDIVATVEHIEEGSVLHPTGGPQGGMKMPPKIVLKVEIKCNLTDLTNTGIFREVVVVKNPMTNEPKANA